MKNDVTSLMIYRGISARIRYDDEDNIFVGRVIDTPDNIISFEGRTFAELNADFMAAVDEYLAETEVEKRHDTVRLSEDARNAATIAAAASGKTAEQWIHDVILSATRG